MNRINSSLYLYNEHFNFINSLLLKKKLPSSILLSGEKGIGKKTFLLHFFAYLELSDEDKINYLENYCINNINLFNKILNNEYDNIRVIQKNDKSSHITIDQIREVISSCSYETFLGKSRFILILNAEDMNSSSSNALLKILEKPPENTYFFLVRNSNAAVSSTILSRCFKLNIKIPNTESMSIFKKLVEDFDLQAFNNLDIFNKFDTPGSKINRICYLKEHSIESFQLIDIITYCLDDFKKNKNYNSLIYGIEFAKNFFLNQFKYNYEKSNYFYSLFVNNVNDSLKFNADINAAIKILKKAA
jgi:DNA polymerase III subunit delta'|tara:strand:+ start:517 stop:1425 length:909 start_codon:yes stop_codon:yes gene_type:complete